MRIIDKTKDGMKMEKETQSMYISTYTKVRMNPTNPKKEDIRIEDIAHALSLMTRANGHFKTFYSVAQHSVNCADEAEKRGYSGRVRLACLLHDASEAYLSDITRPVKAQFPQYLKFEENLQNTIWDFAGISKLTDEEEEQVKEIDDAMLYFEFLNLHDTKLFGSEPYLLSSPDFSEKHFSFFENKFLEKYHDLEGDI